MTNGNVKMIVPTAPHLMGFSENKKCEFRRLSRKLELFIIGLGDVDGKASLEVLRKGLKGEGWISILSRDTTAGLLEKAIVNLLKLEREFPWLLQSQLKQITNYDGGDCEEENLERFKKELIMFHSPFSHVLRQHLQTDRSLTMGFLLLRALKVQGSWKQQVEPCNECGCDYDLHDYRHCGRCDTSYKYCNDCRTKCIDCDCSRGGCSACGCSEGAHGTAFCQECNREKVICHECGSTCRNCDC